MEGKRLRKLPIEYLWEGMVLKDNIYNHTGSVLLISKGETITAGKLQKLLNFDGEDKHIMVYEDIVYQILSEKNVPDKVRQKITEDYAGYSEIKHNVGAAFHRADYENWVHDDEFQSVIQEITGKLNDVDPIVLFACIHFPRPMDENLQRHSLNVAFLNGLMGEWLKLSKEDINILVMAGLLHDVGKTKIPEEILNAPRKLTKDEIKIMQMHPVYSYELLVQGGFDERVRLAARHHHEKLNGQGYPDRLKGEEISLFARITSVSDIYDAMVSKRSYKEERLPLDVFDMFYKRKYDGLDMDLVAIFLNNMRKSFLNKKVIMSDGEIGTIRYIPPNDADHPVVECGELIKQTDKEWYCEKILSEF